MQREIGSPSRAPSLRIRRRWLSVGRSADLGKIIVATLKGMMGSTPGNTLEDSWDKVVDAVPIIVLAPFIVFSTKLAIIASTAWPSWPRREDLSGFRWYSPRKTSPRCSAKTIKKPNPSSPVLPTRSSCGWKNLSRPQTQWTERAPKVEAAKSREPVPDLETAVRSGNVQDMTASFLAELLEG